MTANTNILKSSLIIFILATIYACENDEPNKIIDKNYFYEYYSSTDTITPYKYILKKVLWKENEAYSITDYYYSKTGEFEDKKVFNFIIKNDSLYKCFKINGKNDTLLYLTTKSKVCIDCKTEATFMNTSICLLDAKDPKFSSFKFSKKMGEIDGVNTILYLDNNFITVQEEYQDGYRGYFKIIRVESIPKFINIENPKN